MKRLIVGLLVVANILFLALLPAARSRGAAPPLAAKQESMADAVFAPPPAAPSPVVAEAVPQDGPRRSRAKGGLEKLKKPGLGFGGVGVGGGGSAVGNMSGAADQAPSAAEKDAEASMEPPEPPANTRAWFPETFLFAPRVITDARGEATVPVRVPDRLTTWRVLGLAHSRAGAQAGALTSFLGTLTVYVDAVTPPFLYAGDEVRLPLQVVNTTDAPVTSSLSLEVQGGSISGSPGSLSLSPGGSTVRYVTAKTSRPGTLMVKATLGSTDAVEKTIPVKPAGAPVRLNRGGTLAAPRQLTVEGWPDALPGSEEVRVTVYPGALGLVRSELSAAPSRGGTAEDAYLLALLGKAPALLAALGSEAKADVVRDLTVLATQRAVRAARASSVDVAVLYAAAAQAHPNHPILSRMGERLAAQIAGAQRPDGTCQGATGWTLQRLLVTTAACARAVQATDGSGPAAQRAQRVRVKASGAVERNLGRVDDAYTAAALLAAGLATGGAKEVLVKKVMESLVLDPSGAQLVPVSGVVRPDGTSPSTLEATAMAILALRDVPHAPLANLGTTVLSGYNAYFGWGDGQANLVALEAVTTLFKDKVPDSVSLTLTKDGALVARGTFNAAQLKDVVTIAGDASGSGGSHVWEISASPAVPGLGFSFSLAAHVPWRPSPTAAGLELNVSPKAPTFTVGRPTALTYTVAAPAHVPTALVVSLPAGVAADTEALSRAIGAHLLRFESADGLLTLHLAGRAGGETTAVEVRFIPTLAGRLQAAPVELKTDDGRQRATFAPERWLVTGQ